MLGETKLQKKSEKFRNLELKNLFSFFGLLVVVVLFSVTTNGKFLRTGNLMLILKQSVLVMIGALGSSFVLSHGNLDFSIGGEMALTCLLSYHISAMFPHLLFPACVLIAMTLSLIVATVHVVVGVPAFVSGMCVMFIGKGILQAVSGAGLMIDPMYNKLDSTWFYVAVLVAVFVLAFILFNYTKIGRYNRLIGSNPKAAFLSGINEKKYKILAFLCSGFAVGVATFLTIIRSGGLSAQTGQLYEIDTVIVLTLGGAPLSGGSGVKLRSAVLGALTYYVLNNGLILLGVSAEVIYIIKGVLFLVIVGLTFDRSNKI